MNDALRLLPKVPKESVATLPYSRTAFRKGIEEYCVLARTNELMRRNNRERLTALYSDS